MSLSIVIEAQSESAGANRATSSAGKKKILWRGKRQLKDDCTDFLSVGSEDEEFLVILFPPQFPPSPFAYTCEIRHPSAPVRK